jgi:hypothetical protein
VEIRMPNGRCEVKSSGKVNCVPSTVYFTLCIPDLTYWPYDQVNCSLRLGAWMQKGEEINLTTQQDNVSSTEFEYVKLINPLLGRHFTHPFRLALEPKKPPVQ